MERKKIRKYDKKMKEYGKIKREYDKFREIRKNLGLKDSKFMDIEKMRENLKQKNI